MIQKDEEMLKLLKAAQGNKDVAEWERIKFAEAKNNKPNRLGFRNVIRYE